MKRLITVVLVAVVGVSPAMAQQTTAVNTELPTASALSDAFANPTAPPVGSFTMVWDTTQWKRLAVGTAGTPAATVVSMQGVTNGTPVPVTATNLDVQSGGADLSTAANQATIIAALQNIEADANILQDIWDDTGNRVGVFLRDAAGAAVTLASDYAVDADAPDAPFGPTLLCERDDALAALTPIEGDWAHCRLGSTGALWVGLAAGDLDVGNVDLEFAGTAASTGIGASGAQTLRIVPASTSKFRSIDLDETEEEADDDGGEMCAVWVTNTATATRWLKIYNADADDVIVGTTAPDLTIGIPGNASDDISGSFATGNGCWAYSTALTLAATTGVADADTGAPGANDVIVNVFTR